MQLVVAYLDELRSLYRSQKPRMRILLGLLLLATGFWLVRCVMWFTSGTAMHSVAGLVTFDGVPIPTGTIVFDPITNGQRREALIKDGRYALTDASGLVPNAEYVVRIRAFRKTGRKYENADPAGSFDEYEQYLPDRYYAEPSVRVTATRRALAKGVDVAVTSGEGP